MFSIIRLCEKSCPFFVPPAIWNFTVNLFKKPLFEYIETKEMKFLSVTLFSSYSLDKTIKKIVLQLEKENITHIFMPKGLKEYSYLVPKEENSKIIYKTLFFDIFKKVLKSKGKKEEIADIKIIHESAEELDILKEFKNSKYITLITENTEKAEKITDQIRYETGLEVRVSDNFDNAEIILLLNSADITKYNLKNALVFNLSENNYDKMINNIDIGTSYEFDKMEGYDKKEIVRVLLNNSKNIKEDFKKFNCFINRLEGLK